MIGFATGRTRSVSVRPGAEAGGGGDGAETPAGAPPAEIEGAGQASGKRSPVPDPARRLRRAREAVDMLVSERMRALSRQLADARALADLLDEHLALLLTICDLHEHQGGTGVVGYRLDTGAAWMTSDCEALLGPLASRRAFLALFPDEIVARIEAFEAQARPGPDGDLLCLSCAIAGPGAGRRAVDMAAALVDTPGGVRQLVSVHRVPEGGSSDPAE